MAVQPAPILLTWEMPEGMWVSTFRSTGPRSKNAFDQAQEFPLPYAVTRVRDHKPARMHLLTSNPIQTSHPGWSCDGQWEWSDAPVRAKSRLFQGMLRIHFRKRKRQKLGYQWVLKEPVHVKSRDGKKSTIWICADFQYIDIEGKDGIAVEISRKVQATNSIWEEMGQGIYGLNSESQQVRVKVRDASEDGTMRSMKLVKITDEDLNTPAWDNSDLTVAEYWNQGEERYSATDAAEIPVILVNRFKGDNTSKYPADQVYRVMSMENWPTEVRQHLREYLNLTAEDYLRLVKNGMGWFRSWSIDDHDVPVSFGWQNDLEVNHSDSREILKLPNGSNLLNGYWRWFDNVKRFEALHSRPPPSVDAHYIVPPGNENHLGDLIKHANLIFDQIPGWKERVKHHDLKVIPDDSKAKADLFIERMISDISSNDRSVVVFSALPPRQSNPEVDLYTGLKYALDEAGLIHQNFAIQSRYSLKKRPDSASAKVNVLQMLLKHGFLPVPYTCSIGDVDVVCALDVGRIGPNESVTAFAVAITKSGQLWGTTPKGEPQKGETISEDAIRRTIKGIIRRNELVNDELPARILMMRDGNTPRRELERIQKIIAEYRELGVDICWISVRKSGCPRLLNFDGDRVVNKLPLKGHWMRYGERSAWIWTTGDPELKEGRPGIPQGSAFTIEVNFENDPLSIGETASLLIAHAHASQMQPWNSTRLPFVHHLADKMAKAMANGWIPLDQNGNRFSAA